jgi:hypothetical protein
MSAQRLSDKTTRRLSRAIGIDVVRAWAHGGYTYDFVVADASDPSGHRHGWYEKKSGDWGLWESQGLSHYNTCKEMFPTKEAGTSRQGDSSASALH